MLSMAGELLKRKENGSGKKFEFIIINLTVNVLRRLSVYTQ